MKAIVAQDDGRILGFAMIGAEAGDVKPHHGKHPYQELRYAVLAHPTTAQRRGSLFERVPPRSAST